MKFQCYVNEGVHCWNRDIILLILQGSLMAEISSLNSHTLKMRKIKNISSRNVYDRTTARFQPWQQQEATASLCTPAAEPAAVTAVFLFSEQDNVTSLKERLRKAKKGTEGFSLPVTDIGKFSAGRGVKCRPSHQWEIRLAAG